MARLRSGYPNLMQDTTHTVVAQFDDPTPAREAMVDLEQKGIDADAIHLVGRAPTVPTKDASLDADLRAARRFIDGWARAGLVSAVIGAALVVLGMILFRVEPLGPAIVGGALAGAVGGFAVGGFIGAARRMPVNEDALETYELDPSDRSGVSVEVTVGDPDVAATAVAVLRSHHPRQLERRAA